MSVRGRAAALGLAACSLLAGGCSDPTKCRRASSAAAPLFGASTDPLGLAELEQNAVVALTDRQEASGGLCTGVLIDGAKVLTARHCAEQLPASTRASFGASIEEPLLEVQVEDFESDGELDVAIAHLSELVPSSVAVALAPIDDDQALEVGMLATLAGFGLTEEGVVGTRLFLEEPIVWLDAEEIVVDGGGETGACVGDSGGPLLVRDRGERLRVAGVLSRGSASCVDLDVYQRLEALRAWLAEPSPDPDGYCN